KVAAYPNPPIRNPAIIGPAASPMSQMVPNTPMAAPSRRAEARSAMSALVTGVTAPTPTPSSGAARRKTLRLSLRKINGSARGAKKEANDDDGYAPDAIRDASGYRLRHHGQDQLCAEDDRDLGIVEPNIFGVDRQESEKRPVAEVHDGLDAGRDEDRRRPQHLGETLPEFRPSCSETLSVAHRPIGIGEQQHHKQGEHAERADEKISHRIAGGEIKHEAADERPRGCTDIVCGREPTEPSAPPGLAETRNVSRRDGRK